MWDFIISCLDNVCSFLQSFLQNSADLNNNLLDIEKSKIRPLEEGVNKYSGNRVIRDHWEKSKERHSQKNLNKEPVHLINSGEREIKLIYKFGEENTYYTNPRLIDYKSFKAYCDSLGTDEKKTVRLREPRDLTYWYDPIHSKITRNIRKRYKVKDTK